MQRRAVIFDMDGLLIDSERLVRAAMQRSGHELGYEISDGLYARLIGYNSAHSESVFSESFGADFPAAEFFERTGIYFWQGVEQGELLLRPGACEILSYLAEHKLPYAVATSTRLNSARRCLEAVGLFHRLQAVAAGDEVKATKPAPDLFLLAAERLGIAAPECLAVEDTDVGAEAAISAGMAVVIVPDLRAPQPEIAKQARAVMTSLQELKARLPELVRMDSQ